MVSLTVVVAVVTISALYYYFTRTFNYWKDQNVPGPKPVVFYGNILKSTLRFKPIFEVIDEIYKSYPNEKVVGVFRMTSPNLLIRDLDIIKHVLIKDFENFVDRGIQFSREGLGVNLFHSDGDTWRALRSRFTPMFTNQKLKSMMHLINDRANNFTNYLGENAIKSTEYDIHQLVQKFTMSNISACAFGLDIDTFRDEIEALKKIDKILFTTNFTNEFIMMYPDLLKTLNLSLFPGYMKKFFKDLVKSIIEERNGVPSSRKDFMDLILEMRNKEIQGKKIADDEEVKSMEITDSVIEAQVAVFYAAGYETSASTMGFLLYHLALNQTLQDKARKEIDEYLSRHNGQIELDTLSELTYLDQVFNETMRMYPIVDILQRRAVRDYVCPGTNVKVAKGQVVLISTLGIHTDEKYYPNPEKFNPENFSPENVASRHPCAYLPFGAGPRHCIGMRLAQVQSRVGVIRLLSKFKLEAGKNTPRSFSFDPTRMVLAPSKKLYLNIYPRKDL